MERRKDININLQNRRIQKNRDKVEKRQKSKPSFSPSKRFSLSNPQFGKYDTIIKYTLVPSIPLSIVAILCINPSAWVLSEISTYLFTI